MDSQDSSEEESVFAENKNIPEWSDDDPFYGFESDVSLIFEENFREIEIRCHISWVTFPSHLKRLHSILRF